MSPYHEYVNFMIQRYFQQVAPDRIDAVSQRNNRAVSAVLSRLSQREQDILRRVYSTPDRIDMRSAVNNCAEAINASPISVWSAVRHATREIARERELI